MKTAKEVEERNDKYMNKKETKSGAPFYIALCCCVAVIGLVGYAGRLAADRQAAEEPISNASAGIAPEPTPALLDEINVAVPTVPPVPTEKPIYVQTAGKAEEPTPSPTAEPVEIIAFAQPCSGSVIKQMSADELEYNKALGDWRTHNGVDISLSDGEQVKAIHGGIVTEMFTGVLGETVIVDCKNGFTAVYGCLSETDNISVGQDIAVGDVLGKAGAVGSENTAEAHLHLELIKDGTPVNPCDYIEFASAQ